MRSPASTTQRTRAALAVLLVAAVAPLAGCAGDPDPYEPTGVDELVIPTPSPDPGDFVAEVDNPWFPVVPGTRWVYRSQDGPAPALRVVAAAGPTIAGVRTSELTTTGGAGRTRTTDWFAQDTAGNVWWFGRAGEWRVGRGVAAGLMMPAHPRRGDGYLMAGDGEVRGVVVDTDRSWESPLGSSRHAVVLEVIRRGVAQVESFAPGLGMVQTGGTGLVDVDQPRS